MLFCWFSVQQANPALALLPSPSGSNLGTVSNSIASSSFFLLIWSALDEFLIFLFALCLFAIIYHSCREYLCGKSGYTCACDIYSVGIILFEIYAREDPYEGDGHLMKVLHDVCNPRINKRPYVPETMPPKMVDIMKKCWAADPFFR